MVEEQYVFAYQYLLTIMEQMLYTNIQYLYNFEKTSRYLYDEIIQIYIHFEDIVVHRIEIKLNLIKLIQAINEIHVERLIMDILLKNRF